jgi:hypothetical protein
MDCSGDFPKGSGLAARKSNSIIDEFLYRAGLLGYCLRCRESVSDVLTRYRWQLAEPVNKQNWKHATRSLSIRVEARVHVHIYKCLLNLFPVTNVVTDIAVQ